MSPRIPVLAMPLLLIAAFAQAAVTPPGVNLRWDQCYDDAGVMNKTFACDTNAGSQRLVASFVLDTPMDSVSGCELYLDLRSASAALPSWWHFKSVGTCRQFSLALTTLTPPGSVNCVDWADGLAQGGIAGYSLSGIDPTAARLLAALAVPTDQLRSLDAGVEYFTAGFTINHARTVGTGACEGCSEPVCLRLDAILLTTPVQAGNRDLTQGANWWVSQLAHWQNGQIQNLVDDCPPFVHLRCQPDFDCVLADPTRSRGSTWGAVKSLYR